MKDWFSRNKGLLAALAMTLLFIVGECFAMYRTGDYRMTLVPLALLVVWLYVVRFETGLLLMALLTPFAIDVALLPKTELSMPVEPMMILFSLFFLFRVLVARNYDLRILRHPVTLLLFASLAWWVVTSCTSRLPLVSFKYLIARLWFVIPFYFAATQIFRNRERIKQFFWAYAIGLGIVIIIATTKTLGNFSDLQTLHRVMQPFYNDHTAYGCAIALMLPAAVYFLLNAVHPATQPLSHPVTQPPSHSPLSTLRSPLSTFFALLVLLALLLIGLFFSYCRAAWISIVGVIGVYVLIRLGLKVKWMVLFFALGVGGFFAYQSDILYKMGKNHQDSSYDLAGQVKSISNISTDASNLERLNRWASAIRIWKEDPILGCGPGTYQFVYGSYQKSYQLSVISTNSGNGGNAHSEYIGPMTEQGLPGVLLVAALFLTTFATGVRVYRTAKDRDIARMALAFTLSLLTYYIHGVFNNFLDTDKLSVPFWAFTAAVVALDLYSEKSGERRVESGEWRTESGERRETRLVLPLVFLFLSTFHSPLSTLQAQPVVRHSCWDIQVPVRDNNVQRPLPCVASRADSGLMLVDIAREYLGTPYHFGGRTPKAFDCAGFALFLYHKFGHELPGWSGAQAKRGIEVSDTRNLQLGDLVFFGGRHHKHVVGHTGIVVEADDSTGVFRFIHASTSAGVIISSSTEPYYKQRYLTARRLFQ